MTPGALGGLAAGLVFLSLMTPPQPAPRTQPGPINSVSPLQLAADTTPPIPGAVYDQVGGDRDFTDQTVSLIASWDEFIEPDPGSQPVTYEYAVGITPQGTEVRCYRPAGQEKTRYLFAPQDIPYLTPGERYFITIRATNAVGLSTIASSDGVLVTLPDGGIPPKPDGGSFPDGCVPPPPDAGVPDGGLPDGGSPISDGGSNQGPTSEDPAAPLGWGCGAAGRAGALTPLALVMLALLPALRRGFSRAWSRE